MDKKIYLQHLKYIGRVVAIVAGTTLFSVLLNSAGIAKENTLMIYMIGVLLTTAYTNGYQYGVAVSFISVMSFNFFFTAPLHTFQIADINDIVLIIIFLIASLISYNLTVKFQKQLLIAQKNEQAARLLHEMSKSFINVTGKDNIVHLGMRYIFEHTKFESEVELIGDKSEVMRDKNHRLGDYMMVPIIGLEKQLGVLKVYNRNQGLSIEQELLIKTAANQIGIAMDRELVYQQQEQIKVEMEREHMKSRMLRSISHDFRTPLTGIIGDCGLILDSEKLEKDNIQILAADINEQALWLMKMMENILNMTKIESGSLHINKQPEVIDDIIYEAASHIRDLHQKRKFTVSLPDEVIVAKMDGKMMVQVMINLLDNAMKHTKEGGRISVLASFRNKKVFIQVEDDGEGIAETMMGKLFDEFVTSASGDSKQKQGIGLGLAICKAVVTEHGGEIWAENKPGGGARLTFWLNAERVNADGR